VAYLTGVGSTLAKLTVGSGSLMAMVDDEPGYGFGVAKLCFYAKLSS
jgi:hypothetical protein